MDSKLVDYSETSSSEEDKHIESKKIAIVQPVPQQQYAEHPSETVPEPESEYQQTHEPTPSPHPSEPSDTGWERLIRSHSSARFCFELSGNSN